MVARYCSFSHPSVCPSIYLRIPARINAAAYAVFSSGVLLGDYDELRSGGGWTDEWLEILQIQNHTLD